LKATKQLKNQLTHKAVVHK